MRTEDELTGALRAAAEYAPGEHGLLEGIALRRRRRTRRRARALAAAAAVVVLAAGVRGVLYRGGEVDAVTPTGRPTPTDLPREPGKALPMERLWPKAIFTMPARNSGGLRYLPIRAISPTTLLLVALGPVKEPDRLEAYDSATGRARVIATAQGTAASVFSSAATDGSTVAWYAFGKKGATRVLEIWTVPLAGGQARLLTTLTGTRGQIGQLAVDGDRVVWSERSGGVWHLPLAGGAPRRLPGGDGLHLNSWPYAGDAPGGADTGDGNQSKVVDLLRGTVIEVKVRKGTKGLRCGPAWCFGRGPDGGFVQRVDGTGITDVKGFGHPKPLSMAPAFDRFVPTDDGVYDIRTGKVGSIGKKSGYIAIGSANPGGVISWRGGPDTVKVLNLAAVPPAQ
ncbi:hypothetical protein [Nonomuraea sp. NPDC050643]|uniref:TolB family protein n=1 Tax=Nonomuraea sp. NPDC050643 TaxID=3155660 RepID=UPI0033E4D574